MERLTPFRPTDMPGVSTLQIENSERLWRVFHDQYAFCLCERSTSQWLYRRTTEPHYPGDLRLIEPGEVHRAVFMPQPSDFRLLFVAPELVENVLDGSGRGRNFHFTVSRTDDFRLAENLRRLHACIAANGDLLEREVLLSESLFHLMTRHAAATRRLRSVPTVSIRRARELLIDRCEAKISLDEIARSVDLNKHHLVASFRQQVGLTPHAFQIAVRLTKARALLRQGHPGGEVAARVGFADQAHLIRHFKRELGVTPSEFAKRERPGRR